MRRRSARRTALAYLVLILTLPIFVLLWMVGLDWLPTHFGDILYPRTVGGRTKGMVTLAVWRFEIEGGWLWREGGRTVLAADLGNEEALLLRLPRGSHPTLNAPRVVTLYVHEGTIAGWMCGLGMTRMTPILPPPEGVARPSASDWDVGSLAALAERLPNRATKVHVISKS